MAAEYFSRTILKGGNIAKAIGEVYPELPYNLLMKLLRKKDVFVNGARCNENAIVKTGDYVSLFLKPTAIPLKEIYCDENLLAVYKPKGVKSDGERSFSSLVSYVKEGATLLHRLDTNTDGILLFSLNPNAENILLSGMKNGEVVKEYRAVVYGETYFKNSKITNYLLKDAQKGKVKIYDHPYQGAEKVELTADTVKNNDGISTLKVVIHGGKTHQIRAQLAHLGHFILGDGKYGDDRVNKMLGYKSQELTAVKITFEFKNDVLRLNGVKIGL